MSREENLEVPKHMQQDQLLKACCSNAMQCLSIASSVFMTRTPSLSLNIYSDRGRLPCGQPRLLLQKCCRSRGFHKAGQVSYSMTSFEPQLLREAHMPSRSCVGCVEHGCHYCEVPYSSADLLLVLASLTPALIPITTHRSSARDHQPSSA